MSEPIGAVHVDVLPRADDFVSSLRARILPDITKLGDDAGRAFVKAFTEPVVKDLPQIFPKTRTSTNRESSKSGKEAGDAFGRELDSRITAAIKALPDIAIDANSSDVEAKLFTIRQQLSELSGKDVKVDLSDKEMLTGLSILRAQLDELTGPEHDIRVRFNASAAQAELAKLEAELKKLDEPAPGSGSGTDKAAKSVSLLGLALVSLLPTIGPIAALAGGGAAALGALGITGAIAVKGIEADMKAGNQTGKLYQTQVNSIKAEWLGLEQTVANSARGGITGAVHELVAAGPQLNTEFAGAARQTGDIAQHLTGGVIAAMRTLDPLVTQLLGDFDKGAVDLERWAQGGGLQSFVTWSQQHLPEIEKDLGEVGKAIVQILSAGAGEGVFILDTLGSVAKVAGILAKDVPGLVPVITDLYIAMQLYKGLGAATAALKGFAAAETEAAVASGAAAGESSLLGSLSTGAAKFAPYAAGAVIAALGVNQASKATKDWAYSNNELARGVHSSLAALNDLGHLHLGAAFAEWTGGAGSTGAKFKAFSKETQGLAAELDKINNQRPVAGQKNYGGTSESPNFDAFNSSRAKTFADATNAVTRSYRDLNRELSSAPVSQAGNSWNTLQSSIQASVDKTDAFLKLGGPTVTTLGGVAVGEKTWDAALQQSAGDKDKALGLIQGLIDAQSKNRTTINELILDQQRLGTYQSDLTDKFGVTSQQIDLYSGALGLSAAKITASGGSVKQAEAEFGSFIQTLKNGSTSLTGWVDATNQFFQAGDNAGTRGALIGQALKAANGDALNFANTMVSVATADQQFITDLAGAKAGVVDWKTGVIDFHNAAAAPLLQDLQGLQDGAVNAAAAIYQHETALHKDSAASDAFTTYVTDTSGALIDQLVHMGHSKAEAQALADQYFSIKNSGDLKKQIELIGQDKVLTALQGILEDLDSITGHNHSVQVVPDTSAAEAALARLRQHILDLPSGSVVIYGGPNSAKASTGAHGMITEFAAGGIEDHSPAIYKAMPGHVRVFAEPDTGWEAYIPGANDGRRPRAKAIAAETVKRLGGVATFESGGFTGVNFAPANATSTAKAQATLVKQLITINNVDINKFLGSLTGTAASIASAERTLVNAVTTAGGGAALAASLAVENKALVKLTESRSAVAVKLKAANAALAADQKQFKAEQTTVATAFTGSFDVISAGYSPEQILANLKSDVATAVLVKQQLAQLKAEGLNKADYQQLAEKGIAAEPALLALSRASKAQIGQLNTGQAQLGAVGSSVGSDVATTLYGAGVSAAQGLVNGLKSQEAAITKEMTHIADVMVGQIRKDLKIHSPSQVAAELGAFVGQGFAVGLRDSHPGVRSAAAGVAAAGLPNARRRQGAVTDFRGAPLIGEVHLANLDMTATVEALYRRISMGAG